MTASTGSVSEPRRATLPEGTVTFLFTDIEGSTTLARSLRERWVAIVEEHDRLLRDAIVSNGGTVVRTEGDAFFGAFATPGSGVRAAADAQHAVASHAWPADAWISVRMGLHTGAGVVVDDDYVGYEVHRAARVAAAGHGGQVLLSDTTRVLVESDLLAGQALRDLGTFRLKDVGPQRLHQLVIEGLEADFPPPRSLEPASNLPAPLSGFVGRERELERVRELLASRLLTLTGPGGTGKTRLALEAARRSGDRFEAVYFVDLAAVTSPGEVVGTIATAVGAREDGGRRAADVLRDQLSGRDVLLVLDNFEQVLDAGGDIAELLAASPQIAALVTSRAPLRLAGEQEFPVPPLQLPDPDDPPPITELSGYESVALFAQRAKAVNPEFSLSADVAPAVAAICARLDGLPLAIELAASRLRTLPPAAILERLERRLPLLTGGARNLPERQRTLRSAIGWSEELLDEPHRAFFARLSVLLGDWTLDAAEAVANPDGELGVDTLDALETLHDQSLVRRGDVGEGGPWFSMLETIREYGLERLGSSDEEHVIRGRHAASFRVLAEQAERGVTGERAVYWRERLDRDQPNLRAAIEWCLETGEAETGLRIASALWRYWQVRGALREGSRALEALLALPEAQPPTALRAMGLRAAGSMAYWSGDLQRSGREYAEALRISEQLNDPEGIAHGLYNLAFSDRLSDETTRAVERMADARRRFAALGDERMAAHTALGLAMFAALRHEPDRAGTLAGEALAIFERLSELQWVPMANAIIAQIAFVRGDEDEALAHTRRALDGSMRLGDVLSVAVQLDIVASLLGRRGHHERALRLAGASQRVKQDVGGKAPRALIESDDAPTLAASSLSGDQIRALLEDGQQLTLDEAADLARSELETLAT